MNKPQKLFVTSFLFILLIIWKSERLYQFVSAVDENPSIAINENDMLNCRYGVNSYTKSPGLQWLSTVGAGWFLDFSPRPPAVASQHEFFPQIRMQQHKSNGVLLPTYTITPTLTFDADGLGNLVLENPGALWLSGNEPDVDNTIQDRMLPQVYAEAYHDIYYFIKGIDPTAHVAIAGLSMMTPGRIQYLDIVWQTYQDRYGEPMPVDVWNMHLYTLSEFDPNKSLEVHGNLYGDGKIALGTDLDLAKRAPLASISYGIECAKDDVYCRAEHDSLDIFQEQLINMRQWMKAHGQQEKPLILSEFSLLYPYFTFPDGSCDLLRDEFNNCFTPDRVDRYMQDTIAYLETAVDPNLGYAADEFRLVQQWGWFASYHVNRDENNNIALGVSSLLKLNYQDYAPGDPAALTLIGNRFKELATASATSVNLVAGEPKQVVGYLNPQNGTGSVSITAGLFNNGLTSILNPFDVTFYADAALSQEITTIRVSPDTDGAVNGCAWGRNTHLVTTVWADLPVGTHNYWVKVDSNNEISAETNELDNVKQGVVTIYPEVTFAPIISR